MARQRSGQQSDRPKRAISKPRAASSRRRSRVQPTTRQLNWAAIAAVALEVAGLLSAAIIGAITSLGWAADWFQGPTFWSHILPFAVTVVGFALAVAVFLRGWLWLRRWLAPRLRLAPLALALGIGTIATTYALRPAFQGELASLHLLVGGRATAERRAIAHQVYAAYRRADLADLQRLLDRAQPYLPAIHEAATTIGVDAEVLAGIAAAESSFLPRDSSDGGRGLFQITTPPADAEAAARRALAVEALDVRDARHNTFIAASTLQRYLAEMHDDLFLGLLAYNIGARNGGLRSIMQQYGARDFVTIQPYLQHLPRDYPIRVLVAALAYRLSRTVGALPRYEDRDNAHHIQQVGIPGLEGVAPPAFTTEWPTSEVKPTTSSRSTRTRAHSGTDSQSSQRPDRVR